jgi:flagellar basal-body rod protein FlgB
MISPSNDSTFSAMEKLLSWTSKRQQALSSNIANTDTPGYHAKDYSFEAEFAASIQMAATENKHISPIHETSSARVFEVESKEKPNGNNVDMERELTELTKNGVEYLTLIQYLNQKIKMLRTAIVDGGKG